MFAYLFWASYSVSSGFCGCAGPPIYPTPRRTWLTDGYGELILFEGDALHTFEITKLSCISARGHAKE